MKEFNSSHQIPSHGLKWENKPYKLHVKRFIEFIFLMRAWRTLLVYTAKNLTSFGSYELIKTQIASIFGKKLKFINSFSLKMFFLAVRPK